jgi:threonine/homoserine/homoserine lactone efflux protein
VQKSTPLAYNPYHLIEAELRKPTLISFITQGITIGFSAGAMPGPMQSYLMNTALKYGWRRALLVVITPLLVDIPVIVAVLLALDALADVVPAIIDAIRVVGGVFVLYLARAAWLDYRAGVTLTDGIDGSPIDRTEPPHRTFLQALLMNALSPGPYLFWTTVNGPTLLRALETSLWWGVAFVAAFYITFLGGYAVLALAIGRLRGIDPHLTRNLLLVIAILLAGFGIFLIWQGVR